MNSTRNEYRNAFRETSREYYWSVPRMLVAGIFAVALIGAATTVFSLVSAPGRVMQRTLGTDNIIANYEWFHDANTQIKARTAQIREHKALLDSPGAPDHTEQYRLRIELGAIKQSCRDLVAKYNANAMKTNRSIFMGQSVPEAINMGVCE